jgi:hypothetical protein
MVKPFTRRDLTVTGYCFDGASELCRVNISLPVNEWFSLKKRKKITAEK